MSTSRAISNRAIPIVMDAGALSDASAKAASHDHADDPSQPLAGPAPVFVMVGDTPIDEAEIAREMQFHRADNPHDARQAAATTLVIRELVRRECERLQLAVETLDGDWRQRWHGPRAGRGAAGQHRRGGRRGAACAAARHRHRAAGRQHRAGRGLGPTPAARRWC
jgi:hypothetical protein